jgi:hypothetical protein
VFLYTHTHTHTHTHTYIYTRWPFVSTRVTRPALSSSFSGSMCGPSRSDLFTRATCWCPLGRTKVTTCHTPCRIPTSPQNTTEHAQVVVSKQRPDKSTVLSLSAADRITARARQTHKITEKGREEHLWKQLIPLLPGLVPFLLPVRALIST